MRADRVGSRLADEAKSSGNEEEDESEGESESDSRDGKSDQHCC
jgi:hypothetical protein